MSVYRSHIVGDAPRLQSRIATRFSDNTGALPSDVPSYRSHPIALVTQLLRDKDVARALTPRGAGPPRPRSRRKMPCSLQRRSSRQVHCREWRSAWRDPASWTVGRRNILQDDWAALSIEPAIGSRAPTACVL